MKLKRETLIGICVILIIAAGVTILYNAGKGRERNALARRIVSSAPKSGIPETIDGLRTAIGLYERQIEQHVADAARAGTYWRILAVRFQDRAMHREALGALEHAIEYYPSDPSLLYLTGFSAAQAAKSALDFNDPQSGNHEADRYYRLAESALRDAIAMDDSYTRPRYLLGVLYLYELDRPEEAVPILERYRELTVNDTGGMILLAHAYTLTGRFSQALDLYDETISIVKDRNQRAALEETRRQVMEMYYGN
jgi:tetratricopeptide (TPR) repeat protein